MIDIKSLPIVCQDVNSYWHYDAEKDAYYRLYKGGDFSFIYGKYLPDPKELWDNRVSRILTTHGRTDVAAVKPTAATYSLWEHRKNTIAAESE
jgi:hypothetical protein